MLQIITIISKTVRQRLFKEIKETYNTHYI